jgi:uncharacterized protein (DUF2236 family)
VSVPDLGLLSRDSVARRTNREAFLLLGGAAAVLLQIAHPLVAAGVGAHSDYRRDLFGRLSRTVNTPLAVVFGTAAEARAGLRRIGRRHVPVRGRAPDGRSYDARDPALIVWVQVTLVLTSLRLFEYVMGRLDDADREAYWQEARFFALELGATPGSLPRTFVDVLAYERHMLATEAIPDANGVAVARDVIRPIRWLPGLAYWPFDAITAGLLPPSLRLAFGLPWRTRERLAFRFVLRALRMGVPVLPSRLRVVPQALRYEERARRR